MENQQTNAYYTPYRKHGTISGLRSAGANSDVIVYDAITHKPKRVEDSFGNKIKDINEQVK